MTDGHALRNVVIVGASLAGLHAARTLRREGYAGSLTLIGDEPDAPYDRPPLSKELLRGELTESEISLPDADEVEATWKLGETATSLDARNRVVGTADGAVHAYDALVLATGSAPRALPVFPASAAGVHVLRTLADARRLRAALTAGSRLLIVGCGFVGIEVASSARSLGAEVTVVSLDPPLAPAGPLVSAAATALMDRHGVHLHVGQTIASAEFHDGVHAVELADGRRLEADHVVVAAGATPNVGWLEGSGADLADGVSCDEALRVVGLPGVVAAGDIVRWPNPTFGGRSMRIEHWSNAVEQGVAAARTLLAAEDPAPFGALPSFWSDHFGIRLQSVGLPSLADSFEITAGTVEDGRFAAAAYADGVLVGAVAYGMPRALIPLRVKLTKTGVALPQTVR